MSEKPISFNAEMVRAILAGQKIMTRRILKPQPLPENDGLEMQIAAPTSINLEPGTRFWRELTPTGVSAGRVLPYQPGDLLWVKETFLKCTGCYGRPGLIYKADARHVPAHRWKPSTNMPRWASRITLEVTGVRIERVQEISEGDAIAEGIYPTSVEVSAPIYSATRWVAPGVLHTNIYNEPDNYAPVYLNPATAFECLWNTIYAKKPENQWEANPWVVVIEFKKLNGSG